ncbi:hypothetical protein DSM25559_5089 [Agrobacterium rosae]|uniref:Uncharacterized protein n=1 Tax=Agrobacterium rosae TaxID=1972867 RepID=A0A1R3U7L7_9HYPH|nr:hypothetical protein DSM25559_5089 [Agrobacterium rosae]
MLRCCEQRFGSPVLDQLAIKHDPDRATERPRNRDIMGDGQEQAPRPDFVPQPCRHRVPQRRVETFCRLVGDQQFSIGRMGHRDCRPLTHAARDLKRIESRGRGKGDLSEILAGGSQAISFCLTLDVAVNLGDLRAHAHRRVQRQPWLLRQEPDASAPALVPPLEQRRFARSICSRDCGQGTTLNVPAQMMDGRMA